MPIASDSSDIRSVSYPYLDVLRGLAALLVMVGHVRALTLVPYGRVEGQNLFDMVLYFVTGLGHEAVIVFFVLSGFLIGRSVIIAHASGRWSWVEYGIDRMSRLWVVLLPALVLTLLLDSVGRSIDHTGFYSGQRFAALNVGPEAEGIFTGPAVFLGNALFLQNIYFPVYGSNSPLWSLSYEFWYYVLFPLVVAVVAAKRGRWFAGVMFVVASWIVGLEVLRYSLIWLVGVCAYWATSNPRLAHGLSRPSVALSAALALFGALVSARLGILHGYPKDCLVGVATAFLVAVLAVRPASLAIIWSPFRELAHCSYSLYAIHFPVAVFVAIAILGGRQSQPTALGLGLFVAVAATALVMAWAFYFAFERNTGAVRRYLRGLRQPMDPVRSRRKG